MTFVYSGLAAALLEVAALAALLREPHSLSAYFAVHALASLAAVASALDGRGLTGWRLAAAAILLFSVGFFTPMAGIAGVLAMSVRARQNAPRRDKFVDHEPPRYEAPLREHAEFHPRSCVAAYTAAGAPVQARLQALLTARTMPPRIANPLIRAMLADPSEDVRLMAYGVLDGRERAVNARIRHAERRLERLGADAPERAALEKTLAELYWELIYQGLAQGRLAEHAAAKARVHLADARRLAPGDARLNALEGRLALHEGDCEAARRAFLPGGDLGLPDERMLPYAAEAAFGAKRYAELRSVARALAWINSTDRIRLVVDYWSAPGTRDAPVNPPRKTKARAPA